MPNELTNPNNVVTEERLAQFYQQILPYMGGMPDVLANKFNRADLYSTDEKLIGRWTDGKPLYQKTLHLTSVSIGTSLVNIGDISGLNIENGTIVDFMAVDSEGYISCGGYFSTTLRVPNDNIGVKKSAATTTTTYADVYITIKYTKTTDSAVEIGSDTDYSTTEKIVGTWIDGKPIWQKTIDCGALPNSTSKTVVHGISNLARVVDAKGFSVNDSGMNFPIPYVHTSSGTVAIAPQVALGISDTAIKLTAGSDRSSFTSTYVTIQYTKTSS